MCFFPDSSLHVHGKALHSKRFMHPAGQSLQRVLSPTKTFPGSESIPCVCHRKKQLQPCKHGGFLPCSEQTALLTPIYPLPSKNPAWFNAFFSPSVNVSLLSVGLERSWRRSQPDPSLSCWGISVVLERQSQLSDTPGLGPWGSTCLTSGGAGGRALQPLGCHSGSQGNKSEKESLLKRGGESDF